MWKELTTTGPEEEALETVIKTVKIERWRDNCNNLNNLRNIGLIKCKTLSLRESWTHPPSPIDLFEEFELNQNTCRSFKIFQGNPSGGRWNEVPAEGFISRARDWSHWEVMAEKIQLGKYRTGGRSVHQFYWKNGILAFWAFRVFSRFFWHTPTGYKSTRSSSGLTYSQSKYKETFSSLEFA